MCSLFHDTPCFYGKGEATADPCDSEFRKLNSLYLTLMNDNFLCELVLSVELGLAISYYISTISDV